MIATRQTFMANTAADLMSRTVVLVPKEMSIQGAAHLLGQAKVSGAPVVDEQGRCIGVISATDFLHYTEKGRRPASHDCESVYSWQIVDVPELAEEQVAQLMTKDPVTVAPSTSISELARNMIDAHIHRVIVVDEFGHPIGIVSSTDILAAVAQAGWGLR